MTESEAIIQKAEDSFGRTLSPIEGMTLIELLKSFPFDVIAEAINLSKDKERPIQYLKKVLYNIKNPLESVKKEPSQEVETSSGSEWWNNMKREIQSKEN